MTNPNEELITGIEYILSQMEEGQEAFMESYTDKLGEQRGFHYTKNHDGLWKNDNGTLYMSSWQLACMIARPITLV